MKRKRSGFTLVELIVVIAILGILAGVAIPVYSGYIKKASKAADETLLAAVNTAYGAACYENGIFNTKTVTGNIELEEGKVKTVTVSGITAADEAGTTKDLTESFMKYYKGNENSAFKYFVELAYDTPNGTFVGVDSDGNASASTGSILNQAYEWKNYQAAADAYQISNFKNMGVEGVTGSVDNLAGALSDYPQLFRVVQTGLFAETMEKLGIDLETADNATKANAAVFFVADQVSKMDVNQVLTALQNENPVLGDGTGGLDDYMATLGITGDDAIFLGTAIKYGIATAYVNSEYATEEEKKAFNATTPNSRTQAMTLINAATQGDGYLAYLADTIQDADTGSLEDTDAFFKILKTVSENSDGFANISGDNLFSNPEVLAKIKDILGETAN